MPGLHDNSHVASHTHTLSLSFTSPRFTCTYLPYMNVIKLWDTLLMTPISLSFSLNADASLAVEA